MNNCNFRLSEYILLLSLIYPETGEHNHAQEAFYSYLSLFCCRCPRPAYVKAGARQPSTRAGNSNPKSGHPVPSDKAFHVCRIRRFQDAAGPVRPAGKQGAGGHCRQDKP